MQRITPEVKAYADAHIRARLTSSFDNPPVATREQVMTAIKSGQTFEEVMNQIETRFCSISSIIFVRSIARLSTGIEVPEAYRRDVYKGFKKLFTINQ